MGSRHIVARAVLAGTLLVAPFASAGGVDGQSTIISTRRIGPGAFYKRVVKPWKKSKIHMVTIKLARRSTIDVGLAGNKLGYVETLSSLAARKGAVAAINGDFGTLERRPWNTYAEDGKFIQTERTWGRALSVNASEKDWFIGHPRPNLRLVPEGARPIKIDRVNTGRPARREIALFTGAGKDIQDTPTGSCSARLNRKSKRTINEFGVASQTFEVVATRCRGDRLPIYNGIVISARRTGAKKEGIKSLSKGQTAKLEWSLPPLEKSLDVIGGNPMIVDRGKVLWDVVRDCGYLCRPHPRSAVGITKDNKVIMVVVDGRSEAARGMYLYELARWFVARGAERAMTFDGGGAAEMWVRGKVVNEPSDGHERPVVNALLVLPRKDAEDPTRATAASSIFGSEAVASSQPVSEEEAEEAFQDAASDPGSLGGLADFLERRGAAVPPWVERIAADLRAERTRSG